MGLFRAWIEILGTRQAGHRANQRDRGRRRQRIAARVRPRGDGRPHLLGQVGTRVGSVAAGGATQWLSVPVGDRRAREMLLLNSDPRVQGTRVGPGQSRGPRGDQGGSVHHRGHPEQVALTQKGKDGYAIDLSKLDEAVQDLVSASCSRSSPNAPGTPSSRSTSGRNCRGTPPSATRATGCPCTTPASSHARGCRRSSRSARSTSVALRGPATAGGSSEFLWGPYEHQCPSCGAKGIPRASASAARAAWRSRPARQWPDAGRRDRNGALLA